MAIHGAGRRAVPASRPSLALPSLTPDTMWPFFVGAAEALGEVVAWSESEPAQADASGAPSSTPPARPAASSRCPT